MTGQPFSAAQLAGAVAAAGQELDSATAAAFLAEFERAGLVERNAAGLGWCLTDSGRELSGALGQSEEQAA
jgi:hypothetical protein